MTLREREVIELVAEGLSNKEVADQLGLSPYTIRTHMHNILVKLALHSRLELAAVVHQARVSPSGDVAFSRSSAKQAQAGR
jgi:two-component system nitrate/nitrite response regulator NarL